MGAILKFCKYANLRSEAIMYVLEISWSVRLPRSGQIRRFGNVTLP